MFNYVKLFIYLIAYLAFTAYIAFIALLANIENKVRNKKRPKVLSLSSFIVKRNLQHSSNKHERRILLPVKRGNC